MKTLLKLVLVIAVISLAGNVSAQKPIKFAHINIQELIPTMAEYDSAMVKMQKVQKELQSNLENMEVEYNKKYEEYVTNSKNWTDLVRQSREQELVAMQQRVQTFRESAMEGMQQEEGKLMQPIMEKANKAIEVVAKEQGFTYVLDGRIVLYKSADAQDIMPLVKQHLGIKK